MGSVAVLAVVLLIGGGLCLAAAIAERHQRGRIRSTGTAVWALIVPGPRHPEYEESAYRPLLRFTTDDGDQVEVFSPRPSTRHRPLIEGRKVLIRYDPRDPTQVVMHGGRFISDWVFAAVGLAAVVAAITVLAVA